MRWDSLLLRQPSIELVMGSNEIIVEIDIDCERCYLHEQASLQGFLTFYKKNGGEPKIIPVDELIDVPPYTRVRKSMSLVRIPTYHPYSRVQVDVTLSGDDIGFSTKRVQSQISRIYPLQ